MADHERTRIRVRPIIRVFVSSTFSDLKHERNALLARVWPELERYCQQRGFTFQAIDLRWGVPAEASLDHRTMRICFEELRRSQATSPEPNFLILLGNRYGWRPLPEVISVEEFEKLKTAAQRIQSEPPDPAKKPAESQVELLKKAVEVLEDWYLLDENAKPFGDGTLLGEYVLRTRKALLRGVDYGKQPDAEGKLRDTAAWVDVQFVLWSIINEERAFPPTGLVGRFQALQETSPGIVPSSVRFQASATEQEIWQGALQVANADRHVIAAVREIVDLDAFSNRPRRGDFIDLKDDETPDGDARQALADLKAELERRLSSSPIIRSTCQWAIDQDNNPTGDITTSHLDNFCREILDRFKSIIIEQINAYWGCDLSADDATLAQVRGSQQELDLECADHLRLAGERAPEQTFVGRESELQRIRDYLHSKTNQPFVVHGPSGSGKTALLGKMIQAVTPSRSADGTRAKTGPIVLTRFIGTTPESSNLRSLLSSLCRELRQDFVLTPPLPTDLNELIDEFYSQFDKATAARPVFVFLDALDQLDTAGNGRSVYWIRSPLSSTTDASCHSRMVVSCLSPSDEFPEDSDACEPFRDLKLRKLLNNHELGALDETDAWQLFANWLDDAKRSVSKTQQDMIWSALQKSPACRQPLFLKVLFEEAKLWRSYDAGVRLNEPETSNDFVGALLTQLFDRLSLDVNHGKLLVERALGYIAAARRGMSETELLEVLFADREFRQSIVRASIANKHRMSRRPKRIPIAFWSRLRSDLAPYLTERSAPGGNVVTFYHRQVAEWAKARFIDRAHWGPHERLVHFFAVHELTLLRRVDELPWQLLTLKLWKALYNFLAAPAVLLFLAECSRPDLLVYWEHVERNSRLTMAGAYLPFLEESSTSDEECVIQAISILQTTHPYDLFPTLPRVLDYCKNKGWHRASRHIMLLIPMFDAMQGQAERAGHVLKGVARDLSNSEDTLWRQLAVEGQALAMYLQGDFNSAAALFNDATSAYSDNPSANDSVASLIGKAAVFLASNQCELGLTLLEKAEQTCWSFSDKGQLACVFSMQASLLSKLGRQKEASDKCIKAVDIFRALGNRQGLASCLEWQAKIAERQGNKYEALSFLIEHEQICRDSHFFEKLEDTLTDQARVALSLRDYQHALQVLAELEQRCRDRNDPVALQRALGQKSVPLVWTNAISEAMNCLTEQERICRDLNLPSDLLRTLAGKAILLGRHGKLEQAVATLDEAELLSRSTGETQLLHGVRHQLASLRQRLKPSTHPPSVTNAKSSLSKVQTMWYYSQDKVVKYGPVSMVVIQTLFQQGLLLDSHFISTDGASWGSIADNPDVRGCE